MLARQAEHVAPMLLPNGKKDGKEWRVGDLSGEPGKSLGVCIQGTKAGLWSDFATGEKGDLLDLWAATKNMPFQEALKEAKAYLGIVETEQQFEGRKKKQYVKAKKPKCKAPCDAGLAYLQKRGFKQDTWEAFKIGTDQTSIYFPYIRDGELVMCKWRNMQDKKKNGLTSAGQEPCLFGWQALTGSRDIVICEGEFDAMAFYQYGVPALSVPLGGGAGEKQRWIENEFENLQMFDVIYICFDPDQPGRDGAKEVIRRLGHHRCRLVTLPAKDANQCLLDGIKSKAIHECLQNAIALDPEELKRASNYVDEVIAEFYPEEQVEPGGFQAPWEYTHDKIRFGWAELSIFNGINGHGKSELAGNIVVEAMKQGERVCVASLEMKPRKYLARMTAQACGLSESRPSKPYIRAVNEWWNDHLFIFDLVGTAKRERLLEVFTYASKRYGVRVFVIDSLLKCGIGEDDKDGQKMFVERLCDFKNEHDVHMFLITHTRKSENEHKRPGKMDVRGSGAITDLADNVFNVWRNKFKEEKLRNLPDQKENWTDEHRDIFEKIGGSPDCVWSCDKNRNMSWEGNVRLFFHKNSHQYLSKQTEKPFQYVEFSIMRVVK